MTWYCKGSLLRRGIGHRSSWAKFAAAGLTINNSMSRTFRSGDLSQLVQQTKLTWLRKTVPECHQRWVPRGSDTSARPRVWLGPVGVLCQALEARKNSMGRIRRRRRKRIIWKGENGVTATTTLFPQANSRLNLGTLSHFAPWNKPIHGLELFQFATL